MKKSFQVKTLLGEHICCRVFRNTQANRNWVSQKLAKRLRIQPLLTHREALDRMKEDYNVHLNRKKIYKALMRAKELVEGNKRDQYGKLWDYLVEILRSNPRSTEKLDVKPIPESPPLFNRAYISFDACKRGFKASCRPMIGLDGCFL